MEEGIRYQEEETWNWNVIIGLWWGNRHCWKETTKLRTSVVLKQHFCVTGSQDSLRKASLLHMLLKYVVHKVRQESQGKPSGRTEQLQWTMLPFWTPSQQTLGRVIKGIRRSPNTSPGIRTPVERAVVRNFIHSWIQTRPSWRQHFPSDWQSQKSKQTGARKIRNMSAQVS